MEIIPDSLERYIPYYLTQEAKIGLTKALNDFPSNFNYYTTLYPDDHLQGDGWSSLEVISLETGQRKFVQGILLSNSCDIDPRNNRDLPQKISFSPIIKLENYLLQLEKAGLGRQKIRNKADSIRKQMATALFYLPQGGGLGTEYVALLDDIHSVPISRFSSEKNKSKLFTLSQAGFYLFLLKLSVHFCRFHEQISRG